jgi:hypothetical protein
VRGTTDAKLLLILSDGDFTKTQRNKPRKRRREDSEDTLIFSLNLICLRVCLDKVKQSSLQQGREQKGVDILTGEHADDN